MYFSPTTVGFYTPEIHASMPSDVVEIADGYYNELMRKHANGFAIVAGPGGIPTTAENMIPVIAPKEEAMRRVTKQAFVILDRKAQAAGYPDMNTAASFFASDPKNKELAALVALRIPVQKQVQAFVASLGDSVDLNDVTVFVKTLQEQE